MSKKNVVEEADAPATEALETVTPSAVLALTSAELLADAQEFQDNFQRGDYAMPFLQVMQTNSPQCTVGDPKYIDGALASMLLLTTQKRVFKTTRFVPVHYEKTFIEWKVRESGGGFVKNHGLQGGMSLMSKTRKDDKNRDILPSGNQLVETMQYAVLVDVDGEPVPAVFSLTSTQLKKGRQWNSDIEALRVEVNGKKVRPPMFYMSYFLSTVYESNDKGKWYGVVLKADQPLTELVNGAAFYEAAKVLRKGIEAGNVNLDKAAEAAGAAPEAQEEIPF